MIDLMYYWVAAYRAGEDAGMWMLNREALVNYLESFVYSNGGK